MKLNPSLRLPTLFVLAFCCLAGCRSSQHVEFVKSANDTNIKKMGNAYMLYASWPNYTGPGSLEELKSFLTSDARIEKNLQLMGIERENVDQYFISENDGKEFEFRWGVFINPDRQRSTEPLVFEKEGKDGTRLVMLSNRKILEVNNDRKYEKLLTGKIDREDAITDLEKEEEAQLNAAE